MEGTRTYALELSAFEEDPTDMCEVLDEND